jgi:hypothetical protein
MYARPLLACRHASRRFTGVHRSGSFCRQDFKSPFEHNSITIAI